MLTKEQQQHIFNEAYKHCVKQGERASAGATCHYQMDGGLKCAIGAGMNETDLERFGHRIARVARLLEDGLDELFGISVGERDDRFLTELQEMHDNASALGDDFKTDVKHNAKYLAWKYGLTMPEIGEVDQ